MIDRRPALLRFCLLLAASAPAGCGGGGGDLTVATNWPAAERARIEEAYLGRAAENPSGPPDRVRWVVLDPADDPTRLARRRSPPDVILGGPIGRHRAPLVREGTAVREARRAPLGLALNPSTADDPVAPPTFDDPRRDPTALAWARAVLAEGDWPDGYARLVRSAAVPRRIGRNPGAALGAVGRGEAGRAPAVAPRDGGELKGAAFEPVGSWPEVVEGVSVPAGAANVGAARVFLGLFEEQAAGAPPPPDDAGLLADLLGATLVEAQDELWSALEALGGPSAAGDAGRWLTEPPPWPPASVQRMLDRESNAMEMVETLAKQVAPSADARAWLVRSWLSPTRAVDGDFLAELSGAVDGRLAREPRFRAWLRGEWTAWARQRYRRVARNAEAPRS